jgi:hypothetical protein
MSDVKVSNAVPVRGDITVTVRRADSGEKVRRIEIRNTITYVGLASLVQLWAQRAADPAASTLSMGSLRVGTGTTPPVKGNTALEAQVHSLALLDANKILQLTDPVELKIVATLGTGDANGSALTEAGLFTTGGTMVARQIYPAVNKSAAFVVDYEWRLSFTA